MSDKAGPDADAVLLLLARLLLVAVFLPSGIGKLSGFAGTIGFIASKNLPLPALLAAGAAAFEVAASLALLAGWRLRWAAIALAAFTLLAGALFHDFWAAPPQQALFQRLAFFKNVGIAGGLLALAAAGGGRWALDSRRPSN